MLPIMIAERDAQMFNFYLDGSVREGLRHHYELYSHVYKFSRADRAAALNLATELGETGSRVMITVSQNSYQVWVELRSPESQWNVVTDTISEKALANQAAKHKTIAAMQRVVSCGAAVAF